MFLFFKKFSMENNKQLILGLDLGVASVGWALISEQWDEKVFLDAWVKIFQEPVEAKSRAPKNQARREARGARRNLKRKVERKIALKNTLHRSGLLLSENFCKNIYELRSRALDKKLEKDELAAVLYHFGQKRWFLSNAKGRSSEDGAVKSSISSITENMKLLGARTLGEYRYFLMKHRKENNLPPQKFEEKYTSRAMYKEELEKIWEKQASFYPEILSKELKNEIFYFIFYQRPLKLQKNLVGSCSYFPSRKRAEKAGFVAQEFLVWKQVSDLKYKTKWSWNFEEISFADKQKLVEVLMEQGSYSFAKAKKLLGLPEEVIFNLEKSKKQLEGNKTNSALEKFLKNSENFVSENIFVPKDASYEDVKRMLLQDILTIHVDEYLAKRLGEFWKISEKWIAELLSIKMKLPAGYVNYSEKAIKKIMEVMRQTGENDRKIIEDLRKNGKFPNEKNVYANMKNPWQELPVLRNPSVTKTIVEARKVIKAISHVYGIPTLVRIEMASDLKNTKKQKEKILKNQKELEKLNNEAIRVITEMNQSVTYNKILLYRLHKECGGICPYTGKTIDLPRLIMWDSGFDVEHIIPYSRCLDDSFKNKTLCDADYNRNIKRNKTPYEIGQENPEQYADIIARVKKHIPGKIWKFELQEINTDDFISRQLNDTRYICREVKQFCEALIGRNNVEITKGTLTAMLRKFWNFNLEDFVQKDDIPWQDGEGAKKGRSDHRHHAVDAIVVALTGRNLLQKASHQSANNEIRFWDGDDSMKKLSHVYNEFCPGEKFRSDAKDKIESMIISHTPVHKIRESLHEETAFGKIFDRETKKEMFVVRKDVSSLDLKKLKDVVDVEVRAILQKYFTENGKYLAEKPPLHKDGKTPIKSVRMKENKSNMYDFRGEWNKFFVFGNNHHVEIIEHKTLKNKDGTPKREGIFVTMWEANRRAKNKESIVNRIGPWKNEIKEKFFDNSEWNFVCSLCNNDMVKYFPNPENKEEFEICRVQKMLATRTIIFLTSHIEAMSDKFFEVGVWWLWKIQKIQIDALWNIFPSND